MRKSLTRQGAPVDTCRWTCPSAATTARPRPTSATLSHVDTASPPSPPAAAPPARQVAIRDRVAGVLLAAGALTPLLIAAGLNANPQGHGTHLQLGMAPCGFLVASGLPCGTCGMTTAFTHAADGNLLAAAAVQPAGALLALLCAVAALIGTYTAFTGMALTRLLGQLARGRVVLIAIAVFLAAWGYTTWRFTQVGT